MHQSKLLLLFLLIGLRVFAQEYQISGKVIDSDTQEPLEASTVYVESVRDSSMVAYTITDQNGVFVLDARTSSDALNLFITYNGYKPDVRQLKLDQKKITLGSVALELQAEQLEGVSVVGERIPLVIKKDT
ncbi:carboxypeptidase-like regulatory domain-containing protein, partial [Galbibacter sp.]|uniref:carboxypeptidase-like regulatory domain-containing protein n=1 Tax=Galbibacter sp. TaxID=2918471 RepID=UPI002B8CE763